MKTVGMLAVLAGGVGAGLLVQQALTPQAWAQSAPKTTGPGVQATSDTKEPDLLKTCKTPPPAPAARGGRGGFGAKGGPKGGAKGGPRGGGQAEASPREYSVTEIPGVIAAGAKWKDVWTGEGNNSDGIIADDGGILIAQNDNSDVLKLDKDGKTSVAYSGLNTSGSVARNSKGALFVVNRGLNMSIDELAPQRKVLANKLANGDPIDCAGGGVLNDVTADSKGGVYFTMGTVYHADAKGNITKYGENLFTNGIMLSTDEKHLWVTNGSTLAEFDVQKDGSLTNQREFAKLQGGGDGSTFDAAGRLYVTVGGANPGIDVISPEGKELGLIPTPRGVISVTFSGPDRKTLYAVSNDRRNDVIMTIPMIAQGPKGRGK